MTNIMYKFATLMADPLTNCAFNLNEILQIFLEYKK